MQHNGGSSSSVRRVIAKVRFCTCTVLAPVNVLGPDAHMRDGQHKSIGGRVNRRPLILQSGVCRDARRSES